MQIHGACLVAEADAQQALARRHGCTRPRQQVRYPRQLLVCAVARARQHVAVKGAQRRQLPRLRLKGRDLDVCVPRQLDCWRGERRDCAWQRAAHTRAWSMEGSSSAPPMKRANIGAYGSLGAARRRASARRCEAGAAQASVRTAIDTHFPGLLRTATRSGLCRRTSGVDAPDADAITPRRSACGRQRARSRQRALATRMRVRWRLGATRASAGALHRAVQRPQRSVERRAGFESLQLKAPS
jgi:hypothetical protein